MTNKNYLPATLLADFYKLSHREQYPKNTEYVYSTFTPRSNKYFPIADKVVVFGMQGFIKKYLINYFNDNFFQRRKEDVIAEYERVVKFSLGKENPDSTHVKELWEVGHLPIEIKCLPEGSLAPIRVPVLTIENTDKRFFWLTNYLETLISTEIWQSMTSATIALQYKKVLEEYALKTTGSVDAVKFQGHDFSMRGMSSLESAQLSGAGHLLSFVGTDTIPAILYLENYYNTNIEKELVGTSISATEHSVQCANADETLDETETFKRFMTEVYPTGIFSIVSDTYDFWDNICRVLPALKETIMNRDGKVVIRPDSGDPVLILCGDPNGKTKAEKKGLVRLLWEIFGGTFTEQGYRLLDSHIGAIYGDSITVERATEIVKRLEQNGFASTNVVFGIGSFTYQYNTRDTFGFAMKATWAQIDGVEKQIFKDPKTDDGLKKSQKGRVVVVESQGEITYKDGLYKHEADALDYIDLLQPVFRNGKLLVDQSLSEIREHLQNQ